MPLRYPTTSRTLLEKIAAGDGIGWDEFYEKYAPVVRALARGKGIEDAEDICQQVMLQFFKQSGTFRFDPGLARFRTYFGRIVRAKIADHFRRGRDAVRDQVLFLQQIDHQTYQGSDDFGGYIRVFLPFKRQPDAFPHPAAAFTLSSPA